MNYEDILPDNWFDVSSERSDRFTSRVLQHLYDENYMFNECMKCPLFRTFLQGGVLYTGCIFATKCIKEYPHSKDNKEFK